MKARQLQVRQARLQVIAQARHGAGQLLPVRLDQLLRPRLPRLVVRSIAHILQQAFDLLVHLVGHLLQHVLHLVEPAADPGGPKGVGDRKGSGIFALRRPASSLRRIVSAAGGGGEGKPGRMNGGTNRGGGSGEGEPTTVGRSHRLKAPSQRPDAAPHQLSPTHCGEGMPTVGAGMRTRLALMSTAGALVKTAQASLPTAPA
jgi:hypothetical protein